MDFSHLTVSVKYIPTESQGILEMRFMTDIARAWRESTGSRLDNPTQDSIIKEWAAGFVSLLIKRDRFMEIRAKYYSI